MKIRTLSALLVTTAVSSIAPAQADMIYDVTFEDPPHVLNNPVATSEGMLSDRPYGTIGTVMTRSGLADFSTQVASLEPAGIMSFYAPTIVNSGLVTLSWDMAMFDSETASVLIQAGGGGSGTISMFWEIGLNFRIGATNVATFTLGQQDHYEFLLDLDNDRYDFAFNGTPVLTNRPLNASFNVNYVNFAAENLQSPSYAVDNFQWEVIPEPSTWLLISTGGLAAVYGRRIMKSKDAGQ